MNPFEYVEFKIEPLDAEDMEHREFVARSLMQDEEKCGNIFISNSGTYSFICEFCENRFENMSTFGSHLFSKHFSCELQDAVISAFTRPASHLQSKEKLPDFPNQLEFIDGLIETQDVVLSELQEDDNDSDEIMDSRDGIMVESSELDGTLETEDQGETKKGNAEIVLSEDGNESNLEDQSFDNSKLYCHICNRTFARKTTFTIHKRRHKVYGTWPSMFKSIKRRTRKSKSKKVDPVPKDPSLYCDICNRYFSKLHILKTHSEWKHGNTIPKALENESTYLQCRYCDDNAKFDNVLERIAHESTHNKARPYRCNQCPKGFRNKVELSFHHNSHTGAHPYSCPHCPKSFTTTINLNSHIRLHLGIKPYACRFCDKRFPLRKSCDLHEQVHTKEKSLQCDECGQQYRRIGELSLHKKRHEKNRDCKCDICGKQFYSNNEVKMHRISHTDERPHKCDECDKTFQRRKSLIAHKQLHSDIKRYECTVCGKRFAQCAGLHSHRKTHGEKMTG